MPSRTAHSASRLGVIGAVVSGIAASICCVVPLILLALGVGGAWASSLRFLDPYRPLFIALTLGFLGFAFYRAYRAPTESCSTDGSCATASPPRATRATLWIITPLILGLLALPYLTPHLFGGGDTPQGGQARAPAGQTPTAGTSPVVLKVDGMTCAACTVTVKKSLTALDGVTDASVTADPPRAVVAYDPARLSTDSLMKATAQAGYPSAVKDGEKP